MVMVNPIINPQACWEFEGEVLVLHHPTTISSRYQAMVHCGSIRQTASILSMSQDCLRTGNYQVYYFFDNAKGESKTRKFKIAKPGYLYLRLNSYSI